VKIAGEWYFGQHDGDEFRIFRLASGDAEPVASLSVANLHRPTLVRSNDGARLGALVRTRAGDWFLYPLDETYAPDWPLVVTREKLNGAPTACPDAASGWTVVSLVPPTRLDPSQDSSVLSFPDAPSARANGVRARILVRDGSVCVSELAASLGGRPERDSVLARSASLPADSVSLLLRDSKLERQLEFRCSL
jgi:hypothetical protein